MSPPNGNVNGSVESGDPLRRPAPSPLVVGMNAASVYTPDQIKHFVALLEVPFDPAGGQGSTPYIKDGPSTKATGVSSPGNSGHLISIQKSHRRAIPKSGLDTFPFYSWASHFPTNLLLARVPPGEYLAVARVGTPHPITGCIELTAERSNPTEAEDGSMMHVRDSGKRSFSRATS